MAAKQHSTPNLSAENLSRLGSAADDIRARRALVNPANLGDAAGRAADAVSALVLALRGLETHDDDGGIGVRDFPALHWLARVAADAAEGARALAEARAPEWDVFREEADLRQALSILPEIMPAKQDD